MVRVQSTAVAPLTRTPTNIRELMTQMALSEKDMEKIGMIVELVCNRLASVEPKPVGVEELAEFLGVEKTWVYGQTKKLPHFKAGRHTRFIVTDVLAALKRESGYESRQEALYVTNQS